MRAEVELRRPEFLGGIPVHLADGQEWALPGPRELVSGGSVPDPDLGGLLDAVFQAEDESERNSMELALAIHLINRNYQLCPEEYDVLFDGHGFAGATEDLRVAFHDLARRYAEALAPKSDCSGAIPAQGRRFRFPRFLPSRRAANLTAQRAAG